MKLDLCPADILYNFEPSVMFFCAYIFYVKKYLGVDLSKLFSFYLIVTLNRLRTVLKVPRRNFINWYVDDI